MASTLILTPNKTEMCGMYQLAKDLAKELDGDIFYKKSFKLYWRNVYFVSYDKVITLLYPMHWYGSKLKEIGLKWICYDQKIPPVTKLYFPNFFIVFFSK